MQRCIEKDGVSVAFQLKSHKRARNLLVRVNDDGEVVVTKPARISTKFVEKELFTNFDWFLKHIKRLGNEPKKILGHLTPKDYKKNKEKARRLVKSRVKFFNQIYGQKIGTIYIRNQRSRWGSCSHKGNLNFNYKIIFLPQELQDYLIVHEICHLIEMNHSKKFWKFVGQTIPHYKKLDKMLKKY